MRYGYTRVSTVNQDLEMQLQALERKVVLKSIKNTPTRRLVFNVMSASAEFERDMKVDELQKEKL